MKRLVAGFIRLYQKTLSLDHGPLSRFFPYGYCRFYPSCSEYSRLCIAKNGVLKGSWQGIRRILRCNPWSEGGVDEPQ